MVYLYFEGNPFQQDNLTVQQNSLFYRSASADCSINNLLFSKVNPKLDRAIF